MHRAGAAPRADPTQAHAPAPMRTDPADAATPEAFRATRRADAARAIVPWLRPSASIAIGAALVALITAADVMTGFEVRLAILYLVPVALVTWTSDVRWGLGFALVAAVAWAASFGSRHLYSHDVYFYWDGTVLFATLVVFCLLFARLRLALEHSDERFVRVLEGIEAAVYVTDDHGDVPYANRRLARLLAGDTMPKASAIAARFVPQGEHAMSATQPAAWADGTELLDPREGRRYVVQARDMTWVDGRGVHLVVMTDVTDQRIAQELQREHQEALHRTARIVALTEATSSVAHELNQPLIAIVGYNAACLRLLDTPGADLAEVREAMEKARAQAVRAGEILKRLRELTRRRSPEFEPCSLNALVSKSLAWAERDLVRARVAVEVQLDPRLPTVLADRVLIEQVILNLVQNGIDAMRATPEGDRRLRVSTSVQPDGSARVSVADRGHGIAAEASERLYSPFFTTKPGGLGLGLSICRSIVEMHGGRIGHDAVPSGGAAFHFILPRPSP